MTATKDTLIGAARRLLSGGKWVGVADAAAVLAADVPEAAAAGAWKRLHATGWADPGNDNDRLRIGRDRVVREKLQRLVTDGHAEAAGEGDSRVYRIKEPGMATDSPKPRRVWVPIERLIRLPALQMRAGGLDPAHVERLREEARDPDFRGFEPCEAVGPEDKPWLTDGFHRTDAVEKEGKAGQVEVILYPGGYLDALARALRANAKHALNRTPADCQRAFDTLMDTPELLKRVLAGVKEEGGVLRSLAAACGLGASVVQKYLEKRGLKATRQGKLVPVDPAPKPKPVPAEPPPPPAPVPHARAETEPLIAATATGTVEGEPAAASAGEPEPAYTVPPPAPNPMAVPAPPAGSQRGQFAAAGTLADQVVRSLRAAHEGLAQLCGGRGGGHLLRLSVAGEPLVLLRPTERGGVVRQEWQCPALMALVSAVRRSRVRAVCAACGGDGCKACFQTGFVPEDEKLVRRTPNNPALELDDPFTFQEGAGE